MPSWKKVILSGSDATLNSLYVEGPITGSDIQINDWGSVSASLAAISSTGSSQTLQQVTDNGNTTTNNITVAGITASGLIYPSTDGLVNQSIVTDGAGNLTFGNPNSGNTVITIKNVSGGPIAKGTPLYITGSGTSGNLVGVLIADAGNPARMPAGVIAGEDLPNNGDEGVGLINGFINGVDTSAFASGDQVYVAVGGGYTNVAPTGSALIQKLGNVEKSDNSNGSGVINGPGAVRSVPNINPGYTWVGDSNWVAQAVSTASLFVTSASYAITSTSASHALNANNALTASYVASSSYIPTLDQVTDQGNTTTNNIKIGNSITFDEGFETTTYISSSGGKLFINTYDEIVGFNTLTPSLTNASAGGLHVHKNTGGQASIRLTVAGTGSSAGSEITHNITAGNDLYIQNRASGSIFLGTNVASTGTNQFTLDTSGNLTVSGPTTSFGASSNPGGQIVLYNSNSSPGYLRFNDGVGISSSPGYIKYDHSTNDLTFGTNTFEGFKMDIDRRIKFNAYGSGTVTGSAAYLLAVDVTGNIIENPLTVVSASHALNADNAISSSHAIFADTASFLPSTTNLVINSISASNAVFQSASIGYLQTVTGSATIIGDNYIILNNDTPTQRYAGIVVQDSGSTLTTASLEYDGQNNDWFYEYSDDGGVTTDHGVVLFGPEYATKGSPTYLTNNRIPKSVGSHHLNDSNISDNGTRVSSAVSLTVTGSITGSDVTIDDWGSISASLASIESGVATQNLQDVTDNGNTTTNSIAVTGFTSNITGGDGITGTFRSTDGYNRLLLISSGSSGINFGQVNIVLRDQTGGVNNDGTITYGGNNGSTFKIKTVNDVEFQLLGSTTDRGFSFSQGDTGSLYWSAATPFIQRTGSGQTQFLGLATSASYASQALSSSFATTASYVASASYTPTLQQVTTQGSITNTSVTFTGSAANSLQIVNSSGDIPFISVSGSVNTTIGRLVDVVYNALSVNANSTTTIAQLPAPKVAGFTFDYIAYVSGNVLQAGRAGVVKGILRNTDGGAGIAKGFQINETTTLDLIDQGFGTDGLQFSIVQDANGTSNQLVAITDNTWPYTINYTLTIYYNPDFS